jgi:hypothetical protein
MEPQSLASMLLEEHMKSAGGPLVGDPYHSQEIGPEFVNDEVADASPGYEGFHVAAHEMMEHWKNQDHVAFAHSLKNFVQMCKDSDDY